MVIRILAILLCVQSVVLFAQSGTKHSSVPQKSKSCTPAEEKWWSDIRTKGEDISSLSNQLYETDNLGRKAKKIIRQLKDRRSELIALIKTGQDNKYKPPVDDTQITVLYYPRPDYTEDARQLMVAGTVLVAAQFNDDGQVSNARVLRGLGHGLDEKALEVIYRIAFVPSVAGGHFKTTSQKLVVTFTLL